MKKFLPHIASYFILMAIAFAFFKPAVFDGMVLQQSDNIQSRGMQAEAQAYLDQNKSAPLWTNSMFSGMPTYQILYNHQSLFDAVYYLTVLYQEKTTPHTGILLLMVGMYFLLIVLRCDWRVALVGAIGYGLSANFMDLIEAGHSTKIMALGFTAPVLAGAILVFRKSYLLGAAVFTLSLGLQIYSNHVQITYYTMLLLGLMALYSLVLSIKEKSLVMYGKAILVLFLSAILAFGSNVGRLWTTYEYAQETIRGKSDLVEKEPGATGSGTNEGGLSKEYAFSWSYGILETYTLLVPNFMGGSSSENFVNDRNSATLASLQQLGNPELANSLVRDASHYWGSQPFTGGPFYFGAVIWFLFFLGAFLSPFRYKPWLIGATVLTIMMAWGQNFAGFNYFLFDNLPFYNKFRAVTMVLSLSNLLVVMLAMMGLQAYLDTSIDQKRKNQAFLVSAGILGGLMVLGLLISAISDYGTSSNPLMPASVANALQADRAQLLRGDLLRSTILFGLAALLLYGYRKWKFSANLVLASLSLMVLIDMWGVGRRFITNEDFINPMQVARVIAPKEVDRQIQADPDIHYRVADFRQNPFNNAITSYHHKSIGGYHAAKLMRYQELIEKYLSNPGAYQHIYNMLNAKYFIVSDEQAQLNREAYGNAWFVKEYSIVPTADAEFASLETLDPLTTAVVNESFADGLDGFTLTHDATATIRLASYHPDTMVYQYSCTSDQLAVFSEIYYPEKKGWKVYVDNEQIPLLKADFLLRAARLPAGENKQVTMIFAPESYYNGEFVSLITSIFAVLFGIFGIGFYVYRQSIPEANNLTTATIQIKSTPKLKG